MPGTQRDMLRVKNLQIERRAFKFRTPPPPRV
jgi:hypothetical protein